MHAWSFYAAVDARWFDTHSKALGDDYRDQVFANQASIVSPDLLLQFTQKFAASHGLTLPFAIDPQGKLADLVKADYALGQRIGIEHTPTIWVVTANSKGAPFVEVVDRSKLFQLIDQAFADTTSARPPAAAPREKIHRAPGQKARDQTDRSIAPKQKRRIPLWGAPFLFMHRVLFPIPFGNGSPASRPAVMWASRPTFAH